MNPNKTCFIYSITDQVEYAESLAYVETLHVPQGFEVEILAVTEVNSITDAYNQAMASSDAKYKIYLTNNAFVINKQILFDTIEVFIKNPDLGMIGMVGAKTPSLSGNWRDSDYKYGKTIENSSGSMEVVSFNEVVEGYESVCFLDGHVLITQYDLSWRSDLFKGNFYYGESHSLEFIKAGYDVGIPTQDKPWFMLDYRPDRRVRESEECRKTFLKEYSPLLFPKVSVLIPTYNRPQLFSQALQSVLQQTYSHIEIVVCDDSTNTETEELMQQYLDQYPNIRYFKNSINLGQFKNDLQCIELATGRYINFLMDDDLFHPQKIERMMDYFLKDEEEIITLVTSHRELIDENGQVLNGQALTQKVFGQDTMLNGHEFGNLVLKYNWNCIGEPTTVLFRKEDLIEPFGIFNGREYGCNVDTATWLTLLSQGKGVYISDTLSYFRIHGEQQLASEKMKLLGAADYAHEILNAPSKGFLQSEKDQSVALKNCIGYIEKVITELGENVKGTTEFLELDNYYQLLKQ
jgi:glycosyltransferase involved in cell wall biosynthesis